VKVVKREMGALWQLSTFTLKEETPLYNVASPIIGISLYFIMIVVLKKLIPDKSPFDDSKFVKYFAVLHNSILCLISLAMLIGILDAAYDRALEAGAFDLICSQYFGKKVLHGKVGFWLYIYYLSKYYEMIDTLILLVKGKKVSFLHSYHHAVMTGLTWSWVYYGWLEGSWWCVLVNSIIHFFMYLYYTMATVGYDVWWKKYLTSGQIFQFMTGLVYVQVFLYYYFKNLKFSISGAEYISWTIGCGGNLGAALAAHAVNLSFFFLFIQFYFQTYKKKVV